MTMIRVKICYTTPEATGKVFRFDPSSEDFGGRKGFDGLVRRIAGKLGVWPPPHQQHTDNGGGNDASSLFRLTLDGDTVIEETNEIEHGDNLVLVPRDAGGGRPQPSAAGVVAGARGDAATVAVPTAAATKKDPRQGPPGRGGGDGGSGDEVLDVTEEMLAKTAKQKRERQADAISLCSSSDGTESEGFSSTEGSVQDGSDAWESSSSSDGGEDSTVLRDLADGLADTKPPAAVGPAGRKPKRGGGGGPKRKRRPSKPPPESPLEVIMDEKDVPCAPGKHSDGGDDDGYGGREGGDAGDELEEASTLIGGGKKADRAVKDRIIKLLNTGFHDLSNENEAKNAMKLAQRLMRKHNLSQALLLKERESKNRSDRGGNDEEGILKGGMVKVRIVNRKTGRPSQFARWISRLCCPVSENFGVKSYHQVRRGRTCNVVFYGIYTNAQLAGYAFRVATERIAQMTAAYRPREEEGPGVRPCGGTAASTKSSRLSYALGIVSGISDEVERNTALERERRERKLRRARIAASSGEAYEESDDEGDDGVAFGAGAGDWDGSGNGAGEAGVPSGKDRDAGEGPNDRLEELEREERAAIILVDHGEKIAEAVLKEEGIKLSTGRKRKAIQFDRGSYRRGVEDSKEIDINQRALRDETKVKKEEAFI